ncbi:MAG: hypothetical protein SPL30_01515 [Succinivibrio sp.]|jgi:membrane protein implicated in regulation of membrane protease activity|nr:hypothetical protein [Succinivibrio sp.]
MSDTALWFIAFCLILGSEMVLGTVYLLAVAAGALAGAVTALVFAGGPGPFAVAGIVTAAGAVIAWFFRRRLHRISQAQSDEVSNPDEGREISVGKVVNGTARVSYRGTTWEARAREGELKAGIWLIDHVDGPSLVLRPKEPPKSPQDKA